MNKRAMSDEALLTIIGLILVAIIIPFTYQIVSRVIFGGGGEARTATASLESLDLSIMQLIAQPAPFAANRNFPLFIQQGGFAIVSFGAEDQKGWSWCDGMWGGESITRPQACLQDKSCLCVYKDTANSDFDSDVTDNPPVKCMLLPKNVVLLAPVDEQDAPNGNNPRGWNWGANDDVNAPPSVKRVNDARGAPMQQYTGATRYENIVLYGSCGGAVWNAQKTYIEKFLGSDGTIYITIAKESPNTEQRFQALKNAFPVPAPATGPA
jgi:hypothetical protein